MDKYYFIYKDSTGSWKDCTNPRFIASHIYCRAIPKYVVNKYLGYSFIADLVYDMNENLLSDKHTQILIEFDIIP